MESNCIPIFQNTCAIEDPSCEFLSKNIDKTILIFQHPELYFFPEYKNMIFSPFGVKEHGILYWIYKAMQVIHNNTIVM